VSGDPPSGTQVGPRIEAYVADLAAACGGAAGPLASIVVFGSAATGGHAPGVSDVDLLVVLADGVDAPARDRIAGLASALEARHGLARERPRERRGAAVVRRVVDRLAANGRSFFICTRADLLSGEPRRILGLPRAQAAFVDRIAIPSVVGSGMTVWGEELLDRVPLAAIRRIDVVKAWFGLFNQVLLAAAVYPFLPDATRYAMDALKRSVHSCYFCQHGRPAALPAEIAYFQARYGPDPALDRLLALRRAYRRSFRFVLASASSIVRLHARTMRDARLPLEPRRPAPARA
jgi:predicted nucleotidyltransferase